MKKKLSVSELLLQACRCAIDERMSFIDAYKEGTDEPAVAEAKEFVDQLRAYIKRRWPARKGLAKDFPEAVEVRLSDILKQIESVPAEEREL